jgi:hypothetical protein
LVRNFSPSAWAPHNGLSRSVRYGPLRDAALVPAAVVVDRGDLIAMATWSDDAEPVHE